MKHEKGAYLVTEEGYAKLEEAYHQALNKKKEVEKTRPLYGQNSTGEHGDYCTGVFDMLKIQAESEIAECVDLLRRAVIVEKGSSEADVLACGDIVDVEVVSSQGTRYDHIKIVGGMPNVTGSAKCKEASLNCPLVKAIIGKKPGYTTTYNVDKNTFQITIIAIEKENLQEYENQKGQE